MIKRVTIAFFIVLTSMRIVGQQIVDDNSLLVPTTGVTTINTENSKRSKVRVCSHIVGRYVESNYQYLVYLNDIKAISDSSYYNALPQKEYLSLIGLTAEDIKFFTEQYLFEEVYRDYPIVGLDYAQIDDYFKWKSGEFVFAYLEYTNLYRRKENAPITISDYLDDGGEIPAPITSYRIPLEEEALSNIKSGYRRLAKRVEIIDKDFITWIKNNKKYNHLSIATLSGKVVANEYIKKYDLAPSKYYDLKKIRSIIKSDNAVKSIVLDVEKPLSINDGTNEDVKKYIAEIKGVNIISVDVNGKVNIHSGKNVLLPLRSVSVYLDSDCDNLYGNELDFSSLR